MDLFIQYLPMLPIYFHAQPRPAIDYILHQDAHFHPIDIQDTHLHPKDIQDAYLHSKDIQDAYLHPKYTRCLSSSKVYKVSISCLY